MTIAWLHNFAERSTGTIQGLLEVIGEPLNGFVSSLFGDTVSLDQHRGRVPPKRVSRVPAVVPLKVFERTLVLLDSWYPL
jgi:hypothetical protein